MCRPSLHTPTDKQGQRGLRSVPVRVSSSRLDKQVTYLRPYLLTLEHGRGPQPRKSGEGECREPTPQQWTESCSGHHLHSTRMVLLIVFQRGLDETRYCRCGSENEIPCGVLSS